MDDPALRALGKVLHERYTLAARIARATWLAADTSPEAMVAATATLFIELNKLADISAAASTDRDAAGHPAPDSGTVEVPSRCPDCGAPTKDQRATRTPRQPLAKCSERDCRWAIWPDRDRKARR